jgi:ADP-ribose pyrophosphatase
MINTWKKIKEEEFKAGFRRLVKKTFELPNGETNDFDIYNVKKTVAILAITKDQKVILTKQFRPGPEKILLELPGGFVEDNEETAAAAERELLEETGYQGKIQLAGTNYQSAYSNLTKYSYIATDCVKVAEQKLDDTEFIEIVEMPLAEFREHVKSGQMTDIECAYLALDFLKLL